jgi:hypothetical protein
MPIVTDKLKPIVWIVKAVLGRILTKATGSKLDMTVVMSSIVMTDFNLLAFDEDVLRIPGHWIALGVVPDSVAHSPTWFATVSTSFIGVETLYHREK